MAGLFHELEEARGSEVVEDGEIADVMKRYTRCGGGGRGGWWSSVRLGVAEVGGERRVL